MLERYVSLQQEYTKAETRLNDSPTFTVLVHKRNVLVIKDVTVSIARN